MANRLRVNTYVLYNNELVPATETAKNCCTHSIRIKEYRRTYVRVICVCVYLFVYLFIHLFSFISS